MSDLDELLSKPYIRIKNPQAVKSKIARITSDGYEKLLIVSDFDFTLSKYKDPEDNICLITHQVFDECTREVKPELSKQLQSLVNKYGPIEHSTKITKAEKIPQMEDYWNRAHEYIIDSGFSQTDIEGFTSDARIHLRDEAIELIKLAEDRNIPLIVFSAGIGNIIECILKHRLGGALPKQVHIISNFMRFNNDNICESFSQPLIHSFCKNSSVLIEDGQEYIEQIRGRPNILLLGDALEDIHMDIGMVNESIALKIGYLNYAFDERYDAYLDAFDIVLMDSQSMEVPLKLLQLFGRK